MPDITEFISRGIGFGFCFGLVWSFLWSCFFHFLDYLETL